MRHCDTLIAPRWCVPIEPADCVLTDHAVVVTDGRIADLLPLSEALQKYQPSVSIERPDHILRERRGLLGLELRSFDIKMALREHRLIRAVTRTAGYSRAR